MGPVARQHPYDPLSASTVADRLKTARRRRFVGRAAELELFLGALAASEPSFSVLWLHGPGGVGKTALLGAFAESAEDVGVKVVSLDLRAIEPSPPAFMAELGRALGLPTEALSREALAGGEPAVLLLDTFEAAVGLEDWLREEFVPSLPARALVVVAGRNGPGAAWRRDPGWGDLLRVVSLRNLGPDEARAFLRGAGVAEEQQGWMLERLARPPARVGAARGGALAAAGGGGAVGVGRSTRRGRATGGELPGRGTGSASSAGARLRGSRAAHHRGPPGQHLWGRRGRRVVLVAAGPVVHGARDVRPVSARPRAGRHRRGPALARPGRLSGRPPAGASTHRRACLGQRGSRAWACARGSDLLASGKPGGRGVVGLEEPGGGLRGRAAGRRRRGHRAGWSSTTRERSRRRSPRTGWSASPRGSMSSGAVDRSCWALPRTSLCTRPARMTSPATPRHGRRGRTRSAMRRLVRETRCCSRGSWSIVTPTRRRRARSTW